MERRTNPYLRTHYTVQTRWFIDIRTYNNCYYFLLTFEKTRPKYLIYFIESCLATDYLYVRYSHIRSLYMYIETRASLSYSTSSALHYLSHSVYGNDGCMILLRDC